jgi:hypothetical protein
MRNFLFSNQLSFIILFSLLPYTIKAQDSIQPIKNGIFVGIDIVGPCESLITPGKYTIDAKLGWLHRSKFETVVEGGYMNFSSHVNDSIKSFDYYSSGYYSKFGMDWNIYRRNTKDERNFIFVGFRIAYSETEHNGNNIVIYDKFWGSQHYSFSSTKSSYGWAELSVGLRAQLLKFVAIGWDVRLNCLIFSNHDSSLQPYYIAGYGKSANNIVPGLYYYLYFTLGHL